MPSYEMNRGKIVYSMAGGGKGEKGIPTEPPMSEAARDFARQSKSKAIKDPKLGYAGSKDPRRND